MNLILLLKVNALVNYHFVQNQFSYLQKSVVDVCFVLHTVLRWKPGCFIIDPVSCIIPLALLSGVY